MLDAIKTFLSTHLHKFIAMHSSSLGLRTYFELVKLGLGPTSNPQILKGSKEVFIGSVILLTYYVLFSIIREPAMRREKWKAKLEPHSQCCLCSKACIHRYNKMIASLEKKLFRSGTIIQQLSNNLAEANSAPSSMASSTASID